MRQQGAIILGSGGDCCARNTDQSQGTFYEGAVVAGYPSDATDDAVRASIVAAGYQWAPHNRAEPGFRRASLLPAACCYAAATRRP